LEGDIGFVTREVGGRIATWQFFFVPAQIFLKALILKGFSVAPRVCAEARPAISR
jgi:hypothetical protein